MTANYMCNILVPTKPDSLNFFAMDRGLRPKKVVNKIKRVNVTRLVNFLLLLNMGLADLAVHQWS